MVIPLMNRDRGAAEIRSRSRRCPENPSPLRGQSVLPRLSPNNLCGISFRAAAAWVILSAPQPGNTGAIIKARNSTIISHRVADEDFTAECAENHGGRG